MKRIVLPCTLLALVASAATAQTVILDDTLSQLDRTDAPDATGAQWYVGGTTPFTYAGSLQVQSGTASGQFLGYFPQVTLAVGEMLTLSFDLNLTTFGTATGSTAIRVGLFNSGGNATGIADGYGSSSTFQNYAGYAFMFAKGTTASSGLGVRERLTGTATNNNQLLASTGTDVYTANLAQTSSQALTSGETYRTTVTATRTDAGLSLTFGMAGAGVSGYQLSYLDATGPVFTLDTLGILWAGNLLGAGGTGTIDNVRIEVAAIPEPSTWVALTGGLLVGGMVLRRRRAKA